MRSEPVFGRMERSSSGGSVFWDGESWWVFVAQGLPKESGIMRDGPFGFDTEAEAVAFVNGLCAGMGAADLCAEVVTVTHWLKLPEDTAYEEDEADGV